LNPTLFRAVGVVTFALLFYSIAVITEQRQSAISKKVLAFLTAGIICDITSTGLMIAGSRNIPITVHGFIGYSALLVMLVDTVLIWRCWAKNRVKVTDMGMAISTSADIPGGLHIYTRFAYSWWVIAYIAGAIISIILSK
jgi:hypothetical protein